MMRRILLAVQFALLPLPACAATVHVGPNETLRRIADAAAVAQDDDLVLIEAGDYAGDVAIWKQKRLTIRGASERPVLQAEGRSAEGKAIWVIRDGDFVVENIEFRGARVEDGNGAGIRFEHGRLKISNCAFIDNQMGVLTGNAADAELIVENSLFAQAPIQGSPLPHLLYAGRIARLEITGSRFHQGHTGHLVKSRARINDIRYNLIYDGPRGSASYELEFPNGGIAHVIGNVIGQSEDTQNRVVVAYGAEGPAWPENALTLVNNTLVSDLTGAWFLRVWSDRFAPDFRLTAVNNLTAGLGVFSLGASGTFEGNFPALTSMLNGPEMLDFTLPADSLLRGLGVAPDRSGDSVGTPHAEFSLPIGTRPLQAPEKWTPGAFQTEGYIR